MTYPNLLVLDYMQTSGQGNPEAQMKAESYVGTGYQRLLTFEAPGGGFSLMGNPPARVFLSAFGLMQLADMAKVYPVDEAVIERTALWLLARQSVDGTWQAGDYRAGEGALGATSYVAWALIQAGYGDTPEVGRAIAYIREAAPEAQSTYDLALAANALAAYAPGHMMTRAVLDQLYGMRIVDGDMVYWSIGESASYMGATGQSGSTETTALASIAFLQAAVYADAVDGALGYLVQAKDSWGTWSTTQSTILSLKALLLAAGTTPRVSEPAVLRVSLNGEQTQEIAIGENNADVVHVLAFAGGFSTTGENVVDIALQGGGNLMYQVATRYYLPWDQVPAVPAADEWITIDLRYDRTALAVNDTVTMDVTATLNRAGIVKLGIIDLGVPPGFSVQEEDLRLLVEEGLISRYELTGRQIIVYLEDLRYGAPLQFSYRLRARFPLRAKTPPSTAYDYYNPAYTAVRAPVEVKVEP